MAGTRIAFSVSLSPEMMPELERVRKEEHRTRSELIREALRQYFRLRNDKMISDAFSTPLHLRSMEGLLFCMYSWLRPHPREGENVKAVRVILWRLF
jgi:hypothetical protein